MSRGVDGSSPNQGSTPGPSIRKLANLTVPPNRIKVFVRNGVGTAGIANDAARDLTRAGFTATVVPGIVQQGLKTTVIHYGRGQEEQVKTVAAAIPRADVLQLADFGNRIQVTVGSDWAGTTTVTVPDQPG